MVPGGQLVSSADGQSSDKRERESPDITSKPEGKALKTSGEVSWAHAGERVKGGTDASASASASRQREKQIMVDPQTDLTLGLWLLKCTRPSLNGS